MTPYAVAAYYLIAPAEASSNLARYDGVKYGFRTTKEKGLLEMYMKTRQEGFGPEVKRRIMLGTYALSAGYYEAYYGKAQAARTLIKQDFDKSLGRDVSSPRRCPPAAFKLGEKSRDPFANVPFRIFTISVNLAGLPAIAVPCGTPAASCRRAADIGRLFAGREILRAAYDTSRPRIGTQRAGYSSVKIRNVKRHPSAPRTAGKESVRQIQGGGVLQWLMGEHR